MKTEFINNNKVTRMFKKQQQTNTFHTWHNWLDEKWYQIQNEKLSLYTIYTYYL